MKAAARANATDEEPEPVPEYDTLLAEEVILLLCGRSSVLTSARSRHRARRLSASTDFQDLALNTPAAPHACGVPASSADAWALTLPSLHVGASLWGWAPEADHDAFSLS